MTNEKVLHEHLQFYYVPSKDLNKAELRIEREQLAKKRLNIAFSMASVIRRFPFVRGIFLSGDLSKGVAHPDSDIDYVIVTEPNRLWVCRSLLILFKKIFLLNSKKYFCLNYFITAQHLTLSDQNYYTATEIAHLKPLYNFDLFQNYLDANQWITQYFPNYRMFAENSDEVIQRQSIVQQIIESIFPNQLTSSLDTYLLNKMKSIWKKRYAQYDEKLREQIFLSTPGESRAYGGNFEEKILSLYRQKLAQHNLS